MARLRVLEVAQDAQAEPVGVGEIQRARVATAIHQERAHVRVVPNPIPEREAERPPIVSPLPDLRQGEEVIQGVEHEERRLDVGDHGIGGRFRLQGGQVGAVRDRW